jgi:hypothetical protein
MRSPVISLKDQQSLRGEEDEEEWLTTLLTSHPLPSFVTIHFRFFSLHRSQAVVVRFPDAAAVPSAESMIGVTIRMSD